MTQIFTDDSCSSLTPFYEYPMQADTQLMQCMEVWGSNTPVDSSVGMPGLDAWVYCRPYKHADGGGDVYFVSSCATGRIVRLLVADVSGHGSIVSDIAHQLRTLMREHVNRLDQAAFVRNMNQKFTALSADGCFATAVVTTFFAPTNQLVLCNAGHPAPLLYRAKEGQWSLLEKREIGSAVGRGGVFNLPLGIEDLTDYEQFAADLQIGDLVLCYSDSLIESKDTAGNMLGEHGLLKLVQSIDVTDPGKVIPNILQALTAQSPANLDGDDVTILMFRPNGIGTRVPFHRRLTAPFRVLAAAARSLHHGQPMPLPDLKLANLGGAMFGPLNHLWTKRK